MDPPERVQPEPLDSMSRFIRIANELANNPALLSQQDRNEAAEALYDICRMVLTANENLTRWLRRFLDFDFNQGGAGAEFKELEKKYDNVKNGPELHQLKFRCGDIGKIYRDGIQPRLGGWFVSRRKREEAKRIFEELSGADLGMIIFISDDVIEPLNEFVGEVEKHVDAQDMNAAEASRLKYKAEFGELSKQLEMFNGELARLVVHFANIARRPVTL